LLLVSAVLLAAEGCGTGSGSAPPEEQLQVEAVADWYQSYKARHGNQPPPNEEALAKFIESVQRERSVPHTAEDTQKLLTSPRDGRKYVVLYGKTISPRPESNVVVYEAEGTGGTKWVAFESKWSVEVDDAKLKEYLALK
jgi:hypothetical protein